MAKEVNYGLEVTKVNQRGLMKGTRRPIKLEGSNHRALQQLVRGCEEYLTPTHSMLLNLSSLIKTASFTSVVAFTLWNIIWYTPFWAVGTALLAFMILGGGYLSLIAYMELPYSRVWSSVKLIFIVCALCILSL